MPPNSVMSWVTRPRIYAYSILSTLAALSTVAIAFSERSNFYAAVVFLGRSNGCLVVLLNFLLVIALAAGRILQLLYFGQLRRSEVELVCERSWYSLVGTLLAVSIFRDDFSVSFVILFGVLLFLKIFHWLSAERVASIMQAPSVPRIFHVRMTSILFTLLLTDLILVGFSLHMLLVRKVKIGMMVLFTSEFIILTALLGNTIAQYILNCIDMAREDPWEAKSLYVLYVDLAHDVVRLCTHGYFFVLLTRLYGIPLSLIHDLYSAGRSCTIKVKALVRYRQAVKKMQTKYPNATQEDLEATDGTCIICREDMVAIGSENGGEVGMEGVTNVTPKKLGCGHIFHFRCLRSWLERQQSCPTCRRMILDDEPEVPATAPAAPVAPQQRPEQPTEAAATEAAPSAPSTVSSNAATQDPTDAEQAYDNRLQGFLHRLQSDLRKVREEGNVSARQGASRRWTSRSGRSTPRTSGAPGAGFAQPNVGTSLFETRYGRMGGGASLSNSVLPAGVGAEGGGLWMPPPPSALYSGGRRPTHGNASHSESTPSDPADPKGKGKEKEPTSPPLEDPPSDPIDPKEAIRQATLKRFAHLEPPSSSSSNPSPPIPSFTPSMIPLFDPSRIPNFTEHVSTLPHALASLPASLTPNTAQVTANTVQQQITLLTGIQSRIDAVIADLTSVLDVVGLQQPGRSVVATESMVDCQDDSPS